MLASQRGTRLLAVTAALLVALAQVVFAQGLATVNLKAGSVYDGPTLGWGEARCWEGDNQSYAFGLTGKLGEDWDGTVGFFSMDVAGDDPIAGSVRASDLQLLALNARWQVLNEDWKVALEPGVEFPAGSATGRNVAGGASVDWGNHIIPTLAAIGEREYGTWTWTGSVRLAVWPDAEVASNGQTVEGFGTIVGLSLGVSKQLDDRVRIMADVTPIILGDNSIDEDTNQVEAAVVWGVGASYLLFPSHQTWLTAFGSNAFGPTPATSLLAAPGDSICFGLRASSSF